VDWSLLDALMGLKDGDLLPVPNMNKNYPHIIVTFRVDKSYKGDVGAEIKLRTGLGGGDCGAIFSPGLIYLVYGAGPLNGLQVDGCSPGGWIEDSTTAVNLRYLRKQPPLAVDLATNQNRIMTESEEQKSQRMADWQDRQKRYEAATGTVCGKVSPGNHTATDWARVLFFYMGGHSPVSYPQARVKEDGSYCSDRLGPGRYFVYLQRSSDRGVTSASYYPGTSDRAKATPIEVVAGHTQADVNFAVPKNNTYSVYGSITANDRSALVEKNVEVHLIRLDGTEREWFTQTIDFGPTFPLSATKFLDFDNVPPGRYIAFASTSGTGWFTNSVDVTVSNHMKFISLKLEHKDSSR
jgi:hypothetical protein